MLCVVMLGKPDGGYRPIGIETAVLRLWGRLRRPAVRAWELAKAGRQYFYGCAGKSSVGSVWQQQLTAEYAAATGQQHAAILIDLEKCYELFRHADLIRRFLAGGLPASIARLCIASFQLRRYICIAGACSSCVELAGTIVAGNFAATSALKSALLETLDSVAQGWPWVSLYVYVDDMTLQAIDRIRGRLAARLGGAARQLTGGLERDLRCKVNGKKTVILASCGRLYRDVCLALRHASFQRVCRVKSLGIDAGAAGRSGMVRGQRIRVVAKRKPNFSALRAGGARAMLPRLWKTGCARAVSYGCAASGIAEYQLDSVRSVCGQVQHGPGKGRSNTLSPVMAGPKVDPWFDFILEPIYAWAAAVWRGLGPRLRHAVVAFDQAARRLQQGHGSAMHGRGPASATVQALYRIQWQPINAMLWVSDKGVRLDLRRHCPRDVVSLASGAVVGKQWAHIARSTGEPSLEAGATFGPVLRLLRGSFGKAEPRAAQQLRSAVSGALWPQARLAERGLQASDRCPFCGTGKGTIRHYVWACPATLGLRGEVDLRIRAAAASSDEEHPLWSRALLMSTAPFAPAPLEQADPRWEVSGGPGLFEGPCYLDGSVLRGRDQVRTRGALQLSWSMA